jgi:hypothetical protein
LPTEWWPHVHLTADGDDDYPSGLGVTCDQHVESPSRYLSTSEWPLEISKYPNYSEDAGLSAIPYTGQIFLTGDRTSSMSS